MLAYKAALEPRRWHFEWKGQPISREEFLELRSMGEQPQVVIDRYSYEYPNYRALLIRRTFPQLERNLKPETQKIYPHLGGRWSERSHKWTFDSGAQIWLVHCQDERAVNDYIGGNYHFIGIDEANMFYPEWVEGIMSSARTADPELQPQRVLTSNPGNISHLWLKETFVEKCPPEPIGDPVYDEEFDVTYQPKRGGEPHTDENGMTWKFIPATVFDNPSITENNPDYVKFLKNLNPVLRAMWLEGSWDVFKGQYFDQFSQVHHVIPEKNFVFGKHFSKATHNLYRFYDYGTREPFVCLAAAVDNQNNVVIFDEVYDTGMSATQQAKYINRYFWENYHLRPTDFVDDIADSQMWAQDSEKDGELYSPAEFYEDNDIFLSKATKDRKAGAKVMYDALSEPDEGDVPRLRFTSNCEMAIQTIANIPADENDPEDVDTDAKDHWYDAARYGVIEILGGRSMIRDQALGWRDHTQTERTYAGSGGNWKTV